MCIELRNQLVLSSLRRGFERETETEKTPSQRSPPAHSSLHQSSNILIALAYSPAPLEKSQEPLRRREREFYLLCFEGRLTTKVTERMDGQFNHCHQRADTGKRQTEKEKTAQNPTSGPQVMVQQRHPVVRC